MGETKRTKRELAAAFRWAARLGLHESTANHFSAAVSDDGQEFLINPRGVHFSRVRASDLVKVRSRDLADDPLDHDVDPTAWILHGYLHRNVPRARCILHTHMSNATALACLSGFEFLMLDQNACRFHGRIAYDRAYTGMALDDAEGERVAGLLGDGTSVLFLGNHGVMVFGRTVAEAFDELYYLEKAAQLQVLALSTGRPLSLVPDEVAARVCQQWLDDTEAPALHLKALQQILDRDDPDYRD
jgi:ribulose-5-phosphate 4-epimerase/fuculose-1-phosphate aldolase